MKERPILFSAPMVRALLDGTKTQTRRLLKTEPIYDGRFAEGWKLTGKNGREAALCSPMIGELCPYGQPGDRLWVRETWAPMTTGYAYGADPVWNASPDGKWRPSIHMPRAACRIILEVTSVRVERLQAIWANDADCIAEGIEEMPPHPCGTRRWRNYLPGHPQAWSPKLATPGNSFSTLWRSINGDESWDANPWVWVVGFKPLEA